MENRFLNVNETAKMIGLHGVTLSRLIREKKTEGLPPYYRLRKRVKFKLKDVTTFLENAKHNDKGIDDDRETKTTSIAY